MFPRIAIHTGNSVNVENRHPQWEGTVVLQHNDTTATILKYGRNMTNKAKLRHPLGTTFQSGCLASHWVPFNASDFLGMEIVNGKFPTLAVTSNNNAPRAVMGVHAPVAR